MRNSSFIWIIVGIMVLLDIYVFQAVRFVTLPLSGRVRLALLILYWLISLSSVAILVMLPYVNSATWPRSVTTYVFAILIGIFFAKLIASIFFAIDDIRRACTWLIVRYFNNPSVELGEPGEGITRSLFISWLGFAVGGGLFGTLVYGFSNKYRYRVRRLQLAFTNLPKEFSGLKLVQISDIHSGSFTDKRSVMEGVAKILKEEPDLIVFTGDLVNDRSSEMLNYIDVFKELKAPMGVYSVLGNHDYGDYVQWESMQAKLENLERLKEIHNELGWRLLMNEHVPLSRNGSSIALIGTENWSSKGRFPKYGRMKEAHEGTEKYSFKILLSHDPSHWEGEILREYGDIDLMLSGHTHGMQFGVDLPGIKWSPVQYVYKHWAGLYEIGKQKLYVNRGFGFIGYPGRVGILPEITVIELT